MIEISQLVGPALGRDLASNELTGVRKVRKVLTLQVYRCYRRRPHAGLLLALTRKLYKYDQR